MTRLEFDAFSGSLPATSHVEQWGGASVWKVGGKIFAICSIWGDGDHTKLGFKCSDLSYLILIDQPGIIPAPYLARAKWVQIQSPEAMSDQNIEMYIKEAYAIIVGKLTKALRSELGLVQPSSSMRSRTAENSS